MTGARAIFRGDLVWFIVLILFAAVSEDTVQALSWPWKSESSKSKQATTSGGRGRSKYEARQQRHGAIFESVSESSFLTHRPLIKEAQHMLSIRSSLTDDEVDNINDLDVSCWQIAYKKLFSSCRDILRDEEKTCRLAYEFTQCFLTMTGWPAPQRCPDSKPIKSCTEKFDQHTHEVYLAFFVDTMAMCHHLQSEAFQEETDQVINELKQSGHWIVDKVRAVEGLSRRILYDALEQSEKLHEKLATVEAHSELLLQQRSELEGLLNNTLDTVQAVYNNSDQVISMQIELKDIHDEMNSTLHAGMKGLDEAAQHTHQKINDISQGQEEIAKQQVRLAAALAENIQRLKESALRSLDELKESQSLAMEETRSSLKGLSEGARRAQVSFEIWRLELDHKNQLLLKGSEDMLSAQEAFVSKQGSILSTLDRLFSLYDSILYESRALKMFLFYSTCLVFVHVLTSAKQTNNARALLYSGLCISMATELYIMRAYGSVLKNQQWIHTRSYWTRATFGAFAVMVIVYFIVTYRDLTWRNHQLLLEIRQKLSESSTRYVMPSGNYYSKLEDGSDTLTKNSFPSTSFSGFPPTKPCSSNHALASKILHRVHRFIRRRRRGRKQGNKKPEPNDALKVWMASLGLDTAVLDHSDSSDEDDDPDFDCPGTSIDNRQYRYFLRSQCHERCRCTSQMRTYS